MATRATSPASGRRLALALASALVLVSLALGAWWYEFVRGHETTDNAYVAGNVVQITPQIAGAVIWIGADDTDLVKAGQPLLKLDQYEARVAAEQAEAQLGQTVREVRALYANNTVLEAAVALRQTELARAEDDLARRSKLASLGALAVEELEHARGAASTARAALQAAREQAAANRTLTEKTSVERHPSVQRAAARVRETHLMLERTEIRAPLSGFVARRTVQVGQRVAPGAVLMAIIALQDVWVDANFKEAQLRNMRIGQPVQLVSDVYGSDVTYQGRIAGLSAGTGAAFALLPPQNATGNWIKVSQRVPVRISLDAGPLKAYPLRIGLSMRADVDVSDTSGTPLALTARAGPAYSTPAFALPARATEALIQGIIARNSADARK